MFKYVRLVLICGPRILYSYFAWILKYARHPERYPIEKRYHRVRNLTLFVLKYFPVDFQIKNYEHLLNQKQPFVLYANHYSNLDSLIIVALSKRPISFVAKKETLKFPFIGKFIKILDSLTIDRDDLRSQVVAFNKTIELINNGRDVVIFPEGTRNRNDDLALSEFKAGAFKLSFRTGATIIPCALYGTTRPLSTKERLKKYPIWVTFFNPIEKEEFLKINTVEIAPHVQQLINNEIESFKVADTKYLLELKKK